jgi:hypothetical protein
MEKRVHSVTKKLDVYTIARVVNVECMRVAQGLTATTRCVLRSAPAHVVTLGSNEHPSYMRSLWQSFIATNTFDAAL